MPRRKLPFRSSLNFALLIMLVPAGALLLTLEQNSVAQGHGIGAGQTSSQGTVEAKPGKQVFESYCGGCHGLNGDGGQHAPGIAHNPAVQGLSDDALSQFIQHGRPNAGMPSFSFLSRGNIAAIVEYLRALGGNASGITAKGNPSEGESLFFGKAACSGCHMMNGKGGFIGTDLSKFAQSHSPEEIRRIILTPDEALLPRWQVVDVVTHGGQHYSGLVKNEDNFSIQLLSIDGVFHLLMKSSIRTLTRQSRSLMPSDYSKRLSSDEISDLISYLTLSAGSEAKPPHRMHEDE